MNEKVLTKERRAEIYAELAKYTERRNLSLMLDEAMASERAYMRMFAETKPLKYCPAAGCYTCLHCGESDKNAEGFLHSVACAWKLAVETLREGDARDA